MLVEIDLIRIKSILTKTILADIKDLEKYEKWIQTYKKRLEKEGNVAVCTATETKLSEMIQDLEKIKSNQEMYIQENTLILDKINKELKILNYVEGD